MMTWIKILIYIISIVGDACTLERSSIFHGVNVNSSHFASKQSFLLWEMKSSSNQECAVRCLEETACLSFMRDELSGVCKIFSVNFYITSGMTSVGLQIYQRQMSCEDYGYVTLQSTRKCVKLHYTETSWMEANKTCASTGGNILRITTAEMLNDVVWTVSQTDAAFDFFFIDGNDNEVENTWVFSDGTQLSFLPFEGSEPKGRETENCLLFLAEKYYDASCYNYIAKFICEKKIG
ncbi:galactose-specific lectin nattectin-like isoform X2 [Ostrea edulis]|uniref:galactose-specific lectin nattectin-like isoform X2 n=1 Tax=Ostrea edulis TaxID=37623 RepID=UPI0024AFB3B4|nr:galactose-specific lectin nattectin-like isoform X2 [Ostrea edulis]